MNDRRRGFSRTAFRQGMTLLELILVLAVLVAIAGFSWPILRGAFGGSRLRSAADDVRSAWGKAHIAAMSSGHAYLFRCQPQSGAYIVQSWTGAAADADAETEASAAGVDPFVQCDADGHAIVHSLPDDVIFHSGETLADSRAQKVVDSDDGSHSGGGDWAPPILFYPNGETSDAQVQLMHKNGRILTLELRGLNGTSRVVEDGPGGPR